MPGKVFDVTVNSQYIPAGFEATLRDMAKMDRQFNRTISIANNLGRAFGTMGELFNSDLLKGLSQATSQMLNMAYAAHTLETALSALPDSKLKSIMSFAGPVGLAAAAVTVTNDILTQIFNSLGVQTMDQKVAEIKAAIAARQAAAPSYKSSGYQAATSLAWTSPMFANKPEIMEAQNAARSMAFIDENLAKLRASIKLNEGRRLEDIARANARNLININQQLADSMAAAQTTYDKTIANIDQSSADNRERIEKDYQDRIKQIKRDSQQSIDDAIENRDARALAKALNNRSAQLGDAGQQHDRQLDDNQKAIDRQKAQAAQALKDQQAAAQLASAKAMEAQDLANKYAAQDAQIAQRRQLEDYKIATNVLTSAGRERNEKQLSVAQQGFRNIEQGWRDHLDQVYRIINSAAQPQSTLMQAISSYIDTRLGVVFGSK